MQAIGSEVIKRDQEQVFGIRNELVGSGMVLRTRECMVRVAEGHGRDTVWHCLNSVQAACQTACVAN